MYYLIIALALVFHDTTADVAGELYLTNEVE